MNFSLDALGIAALSMNLIWNGWLAGGCTGLNSTVADVGTFGPPGGVGGGAVAQFVFTV
jgi:hypothetical protein